MWERVEGAQVEKNPEEGSKPPRSGEMRSTLGDSRGTPLAEAQGFGNRWQMQLEGNRVRGRFWGLK